MSYTQFYDLTPVEFYYALEDWYELDTQRADLFVHTVFEAMRMQTMTQVNINPYVKTKIKDPRQLFNFPWEAPKTQSVEEMSAILQRLAGGKKK